MPLSDETKKEIKKLYEEGLSVSEIARQTGVSRFQVYDKTKRLEKIAEKGFKSIYEYQGYLIEQRGFSSSAEYLDHLAQQKGFKSHKEYKKSLIQNKINPETGQPFKSYHEYVVYLIKKNRYISKTGYFRDLAVKRSLRKRDRILSDAIIKILDDLDLSTTWLAEELGVSYRKAYTYAQGKLIPKGERLVRLLEIINSKLSDPITLEDLSEESE